PSASAAACRGTRHRPGRRQASGAACERRLAALIAAGLQMRALGLPGVCNRNTATLPVIIGFLGLFKAQQRSGCCDCRRSRSAHFIGLVAMLRFGSLLLAIRHEVAFEHVREVRPLVALRGLGADANRGGRDAVQRQQTGEAIGGDRLTMAPLGPGAALDRDQGLGKLGRRQEKQQSCMTGQHHLDALQLERYVDDSDKLRDGTVARQRNENRSEPMTRLDVSLSHFFGALDELRTARVDPTDPHHGVVMEAIAHLLPPCEIAANSFAQYQLADSGNVGSFEDGLRHVTHAITSSARASSVGGISRPSAFAVLRLMTNSTCWALE